MSVNEMIEIIDKLEREIATLPEGNITKKTIKGKVYYYLRVNKDGKRIETYIDFIELDELRDSIARRKNLQNQLKQIKSQLVNQSASNAKSQSEYKTTVRIGEQLKGQILSVMSYNKRECISELRNYIFNDIYDKVFILYGLRRTGKTTLIRQILSEMSPAQFRSSAFIQITPRDTLADLDSDIRLLEKKGYKYVFIDEITLLEDFIEGAAVFADVYASNGMKIVLSGTDSLGFAFSKSEQLYDRCIMLHTTFIPYREFENVLGIKGIEEYIRYGGTMSLSGADYNSNAPFYNDKNAKEYIDTSIAKNIQHSLKQYEYGGHFRSLLDLYEKGELTNVINRVVENINHRFTRNVVERAFRSHDIAVTSINLLNDRDNPINLKKHIDIEEVTNGIKEMLDILDKEDQSIIIEDSHMAQIKEYLEILDLIVSVDLEYLPEVNKRNTITVIAQPGLRYAQANAIVEKLLDDEKFQNLSLKQRGYILQRLLHEICGRMMEEIVLLETKLANPDKKVFKLQFGIGEFDMVVYNPQEQNCRIYEVKYSKECVPEQYRHIIDEEKCAITEHRFGDIVGKYIIYRGGNTEVDGVQYLNVEEYLKAL